MRYQKFVDAGLTYRQVDYWTRKGYLRASNADCGSGREREWPDGELPVALTMVRLIKAGLTVEAAHRVARVNPAVRSVHIVLEQVP